MAEPVPGFEISWRGKRRGKRCLQIMRRGESDPDLDNIEIQDIGRGHALYLPEDLARQLMRALAQVLGDPDPAPPSELELVTAERDRLRSGLWSVAHTARSYLPKCDGNHGGPRCYDPECWSQED